MRTTSTTGVTRINRAEARDLAAAEFEKFAALAASLGPEEWKTAREGLLVKEKEHTRGRDALAAAR